MSILGDYLRSTRLILGLSSLKSLSDKTARMGKRISSESIRRYELGLKIPSGRAMEVLASALELDSRGQTYFLTLVAMEKLKQKYPESPVTIINEEYMSAVSEAIGTTVRRRLDALGIPDSVSIDIQLEVVDECRKILTFMTGGTTPHIREPSYGSPDL